MAEKKAGVHTAKDEMKFKAVVQISAAILMNEDMRTELYQRGIFSDLNETVVAEAISIVEMIEQNI